MRERVLECFESRSVLGTTSRWRLGRSVKQERRDSSCVSDARGKSVKQIRGFKREKPREVSLLEAEPCGPLKCQTNTDDSVDVCAHRPRRIEGRPLEAAAVVRCPLKFCSGRERVEPAELCPRAWSR